MTLLLRLCKALDPFHHFYLRKLLEQQAGGLQKPSESIFLSRDWSQLEYGCCILVILWVGEWPIRWFADSMIGRNYLVYNYQTIFNSRVQKIATITKNYVNYGWLQSWSPSCHHWLETVSTQWEPLYYTLNSVVSHLWQWKCTWYYGVLYR